MKNLFITIVISSVFYTACNQSDSNIRQVSQTPKDSLKVKKSILLEQQNHLNLKNYDSLVMRIKGTKGIETPIQIPFNLISELNLVDSSFNEKGINYTGKFIGDNINKSFKLIRIDATSEKYLKNIFIVFDNINHINDIKTMTSVCFNCEQWKYYSYVLYTTNGTGIIINYLDTNNVPKKGKLHPELASKINSEKWIINTIGKFERVD